MYGNIYDNIWNVNLRNCMQLSKFGKSVQHLADIPQIQLNLVNVCQHFSKMVAKYCQLVRRCWARNGAKVRNSCSLRSRKRCKVSILYFTWRNRLRYSRERIFQSYLLYFLVPRILKYEDTISWYIRVCLEKLTLWIVICGLRFVTYKLTRTAATKALTGL